MTTTVTTPEWLTADEVAELLRLSKPTVYRLFRSGDLKGRRYSARLIRFAKADVLAFMEGPAK